MTMPYAIALSLHPSIDPIATSKIMLVRDLSRHEDNLMLRIPRDPTLDSTLALIGDPYRFIRNRTRDHRSDCSRFD